MEKVVRLCFIRVEGAGAGFMTLTLFVPFHQSRLQRSDIKQSLDIIAVHRLSTCGTNSCDK